MMKAYLAFVLVALLFDFGITANVPRKLRASSTEEAPVVQTLVGTSLEEDVDNVVDNDSTNVNSDTSLNSVNVLDSTHNVLTPVVTPMVAPVLSAEQGAVKTLSSHQVSNTRLVNPVRTVTTHVSSPLQPVSILQTVPNVQTVSSGVKSVPNLVKKTVSSAPQSQVVYYQTQPQPQYQLVWQSPQNPSVSTQYSTVNDVSAQVSGQVWQPQVWAQPQSLVTYSQLPQHSVSVSQQTVPQNIQNSVKGVSNAPQTHYSVAKDVSAQVSGQAWQPQVWGQPQSPVTYSQLPLNSVSTSQQTVPQTLHWSLKDVSVVPQSTYSAVSEVSGQVWQPQVWGQPQSPVTYGQLPQNSVSTLQQTVPQTPQVWAQPQSPVTYSQVQSQLAYNHQSVGTLQGPTKSAPKNVVSSVENAPLKTNSVSFRLVQNPSVSTHYASKTLAHKVPNPLVIRLSPSKTNSPQTYLSGSQLVSDVADESSRSGVVQETESY